jgi:hypothetical protein
MYKFMAVHSCVKCSISRVLKCKYVNMVYICCYIDWIDCKIEQMDQCTQRVGVWRSAQDRIVYVVCGC